MAASLLALLQVHLQVIHSTVFTELFYIRRGIAQLDYLPATEGPQAHYYREQELAV